MRDKKSHNRRNKKIYEYYCQRWGEGLRDEVIFNELHDIHDIMPKTIENIVRKLRKESQQSQTELDFSNGE